MGNGYEKDPDQRSLSVPLTVVINKRSETIEALLDTGFDGDLILPEGLLTNGKPPDSYLRFTLADQITNVLTPAYLGMDLRAHSCSSHAWHEFDHLKFLVISSSSFATPFEGDKPRFSSSHCLA